MCKILCVVDRRIDIDLNNAKYVLKVKNLLKSRDKVHVSYPTDRLVMLCPIEKEK